MSNQSNSEMIPEPVSAADIQELHENSPIFPDPKKAQIISARIWEQMASPNCREMLDAYACNVMRRWLR